MSSLGYPLMAIFGLLAGSLATMGVYRLADPELSFWSPPPRCPRCHATLGWRQLVPVASWVVARRRCRACHDVIDWAYPVVELVTSVLFVLAAWRRPDAVDLIPLLLLVWVLVVASVTDLYVYLIPNRLLFPALAASVVVMVPLALIDDPARLTQAAVGLVLYFSLLFLPHLVHPAGMGMGDVKLALLLGLNLGYAAGDMLGTVRMVVLAMLIGSLLGVLGGAILALARRAGWNLLPDPLEAVPGDGDGSERAAASSFPFGPPLAVGTLWVLLFPASVGLV